MECRDRYEHVREWRHQLPVAVDVAVIIEGTAKAIALELSAVEIDIGFAEPRRQRCRRAGALQHATSARHHADVCSRSTACRSSHADCGGALTRPPIEHVAYGRPGIAVQLRRGDTGFLEIKLVKLSIRSPRHDTGRTHRAARPERDAEGGDRAKAVGAKARRWPGEVRTPVVAHDNGGRGPVGVRPAHAAAHQNKKRGFFPPPRPPPPPLPPPLPPPP